MENKTQKDLEDEYFLQLEKDMKSLSDESDRAFGFSYLKKEKKGKDEEKYTSSWYEILIIILFVIMAILSFLLEREFYAVVVWMLIIFILSGFSPKVDIPYKQHRSRLNPFHSIFYYFGFYKKNWLYTTLLIITFIFVSIYASIGCDGFEAFLFIILVPFCLLIGLFLGRFLSEIVKFVQRAIKGEVDWKNVFRQLLLVLVIGVIARICIKYDIPGLIGKRI